MRNPAWWPGVFFSYYFYFNKLSETKMPTFADLFLACKGSGLFGFAILIVDFGGCRGLTCVFWAENSKIEEGSRRGRSHERSMRTNSILGVGHDALRELDQAGTSVNLVCVAAKQGKADPIHRLHTSRHDRYGSDYTDTTEERWLLCLHRKTNPSDVFLADLVVVEACRAGLM